MLQTEAEEGKGVPVLVHPESMLRLNEMAAATIFPTGYMVIGPDEIYALQTDSEINLDEGRGVPVLVHPESMLQSNEMASARIFPQVTIEIGADDITAT